MSTQMRKWLRGGLEAFIHGGASAVTAGASVNIVEPGKWGASLKTLELAGVCFLVSGSLRFFQWLSMNPLPTDDSVSVNINPLKPTLQPAPQQNQNP